MRVGGGSFQRIVSLKPNITEILFALGVGNRVVGVTTWCRYPPAATTLPKVADYLRPFPEKVAALNPDLIIGSHENSDRQVTQSIATLGAPVRFFPFRTIAETAASIRDIAALVGKTADGEKMAQMIEKLNATSTGDGISVVAVVGYRPLIVVGHGTFLSDVLSAAGLRNIMGAGSLPYPQLSTERLLALNPDVILDMTMGTEVATDYWKQLPQLKAVREGRVRTLTMDDFHAGPRLPEAVAKLAAVAKPH